MPRLYTMQQVADTLGFSRVTLWRYECKGLVPKPKNNGVRKYYTEGMLRTAIENLTGFKEV